MLKLVTAWVACRCGELVPLFSTTCPHCNNPHPHYLEPVAGESAA